MQPAIMVYLAKKPGLLAAIFACAGDYYHHMPLIHDKNRRILTEGSASLYTQIEKHVSCLSEFL